MVSEPMSESARQLETLIARGYQHGFVTEIDADTVAPGLNEDVVRLISRKKQEPAFLTEIDRKSTRLNSSHDQISYAVFCLKKKKNNRRRDSDRHHNSQERGC